MDAVEQLAASLLAELTPPWSQWFGLVPGRNIGALDYGFFAEMLDGLSQSIQAHFDRSNFALEMHQAFLDLVTVGNATLLCEEAPVGSPSAFALPPFRWPRWCSTPDPKDRSRTIFARAR
jgi:hypothetical protein